MHPRGHELVHIRSMNWVQSTFITCHAFLFFARTSFDILDHLTVSSTTLHHRRACRFQCRHQLRAHEQALCTGVYQALAHKESEHAHMQACLKMHTIMRASWLTAACYRLKAVLLCEVPRVTGSRNSASNQVKR